MGGLVIPMVIENDKVILDDNEYSEIDDMLHYIAIRYNNWSGLEYDDIKSELWVKTLNVIKDSNDINLRFIAKCCYNASYDLCRKAKRKWEVVDTNSELVYTDGYSSLGINKFEDDDDLYLDNIVVQEVVDSFPRNSRERNYLIYLALYLNIPLRDHEEKNLTYEKVYGKYPKTYRQELLIAKALGFSDDTSTGYRKAKYEVRSRLAEMYKIAV